MNRKQFEPWTHEKSIWKSKSQYFTWLRSWLRKIWSDNPLRSEWKKSKLRPVTREEKLAKVFHPSTKNVGMCYLCHNWFSGSKLEIDHIIESDGCYDFETAEKFLWHCAANNPDNWALTCVPCHKIKSYSVSQGITFEESAATKKAIEIEKSKKAVQFLKSKGITPATNAKLRREQLVGYFKQNS